MKRSLLLILASFLMPSARQGAFETFIKTEGVKALIDRLLRNEAHDIHYWHGKFFSIKSSEEEIIQLLKVSL